MSHFSPLFTAKSDPHVAKGGAEITGRRRNGGGPSLLKKEEERREERRRGGKRRGKEEGRGGGSQTRRRPNQITQVTPKNLILKLNF